MPADGTSREYEEWRENVDAIRQQLVSHDRDTRDGFRVLSRNQRAIVSRIDRWHAELVQTFVDEAKDGPRPIHIGTS